MKSLEERMCGNMVIVIFNLTLNKYGVNGKEKAGDQYGIYR